MAAPTKPRDALVLVVDDERAWRRVLETELRMVGYRVVSAANATDAMHSALVETPAAAVIDLMLPGPVDGRRLAALLQEQGLNVPVIMYSANAPSSTEIRSEGVRAFVSKSADRRELYKALSDALRAARSGPAPEARRDRKGSRRSTRD